MSVCIRCGGEGNIDNRFTTYGQPLSTICPDCNGTGEDVGLTDKEHDEIIDARGHLENVIYDLIFFTCDEVISIQDRHDEAKRAIKENIKTNPR